MGLLSRLLGRRRDPRDDLAAVGRRLARDVIDDPLGRAVFGDGPRDPSNDPQYARRLLMSVAVIAATAERLDWPKGRFDPLFDALWMAINQRLVDLGHDNLESPVTVVAVTYAHGLARQALEARMPAAQMEVGRNIALFIDGTVDERLASVSAPIAIECGYRSAAAAQLLNSLGALVPTEAVPRANA